MRSCNITYLLSKMEGTFDQELAGNFLARLVIRKVVEADDNAVRALLELGAHESNTSIDLS